MVVLWQNRCLIFTLFRDLETSTSRGNNMETNSENAETFDRKKDAGFPPFHSKGLLGQGQLFNDKDNAFLKDRRWGLWPTLGFTAIICIVYLIMSGVAVGVSYGVEFAANPDLNENAFFESLLNNNFFFTLYILVTTWSTVGLIILFIALRKGITIKEYLDFNPVSLKVFFRWLGITLLFFLICEASYSLLGLDEPDFMLELYKTAKYPFLLWIVVVLASPVYEEFFFRRFLFEGIRGSKLGPVGAILITSIAWGVIHQQYGIYEIVLISVLGVLFGIAKIKTRSLYTTLALHCIFNLISMAEVAAVS